MAMADIMERQATVAVSALRPDLPRFPASGTYIVKKNRHLIAQGDLDSVVSCSSVRATQELLNSGRTSAILPKAELERRKSAHGKTKYSIYTLRSRLPPAANRDTPAVFETENGEIVPQPLPTTRNLSQKQLELLIKSKERENEQGKVREAQKLEALQEAQKKLGYLEQRARHAEGELKTKAVELQGLQARLAAMEALLAREGQCRREAKERLQQSQKCSGDERAAAQQVYHMYVDLVTAAATHELNS